MLIVLGILFLLLSVGGSFAAMGGSLGILFQPFEITLIAGSAFAIYIISNPAIVIKETFTFSWKTIFSRKVNAQDYKDIIMVIYGINRKVRSEGNWLKVEEDIENPNNSFIFKQYPNILRHERTLEYITDHLRMISLEEKDSYTITELMETDYDTIKDDLARVPKAMHQIADALPALGIVAAVLGIIKAMGAISQPPEILGGLIGAALVGTFMGIFLSYGFVAPLANAIKSRQEKELKCLECARAMMTALANGLQPEICVEFGRKVLLSEERPSFKELEKELMIAKEKFKGNGS